MDVKVEGIVAKSIRHTSHAVKEKAAVWYSFALGRSCNSDIWSP